MAKLVSKPYQSEEEPPPAPFTGEEPSTPLVGIIGICLIIFLFIGALFLVFGAFTPHIPAK